MQVGGGGQCKKTAQSDKTFIEAVSCVYRHRQEGGAGVSTSVLSCAFAPPSAAPVFL